MTATITHLRVCSCGAPGAPLTLISNEPDGEVLHAYICEACHEKVQARLDSVRPVFLAMVQCAVPKYITDDVMAYLLDLLDADEDGGDEFVDDDDTAS